MLGNNNIGIKAIGGKYEVKIFKHAYLFSSGDSYWRKCPTSCL